MDEAGCSNLGQVVLNAVGACSRDPSVKRTKCVGIFGGRLTHLSRRPSIQCNWAVDCMQKAVVDEHPESLSVVIERPCDEVSICKCPPFRGAVTHPTENLDQHVGAKRWKLELLYENGLLMPQVDSSPKKMKSADTGIASTAVPSTLSLEASGRKQDTADVDESNPVVFEEVQTWDVIEV
eukprot:6479994-Amphidinium_carterae.1